ncbi:putative bilirubin oxidase [Exidia glandulosa HHB12029]|uniref:Putative bilirubin oxidase n=1 Tax=Exidia glandulosa HHB12029 TaxID=1314781 RepID=A0A165ARY0_EXIGL|nr:putative bilirubin oxidase [Exidia glandulosa HHB12029]
MLSLGVFVSLALSLVAVAQVPVTPAAKFDWVSPVYTEIFEHPLPIPPTAVPIATFVNATTGQIIDYYEMTIEKFNLQTYPADEGFGPTSYVGYNGTAPGPTFRVTQGRQAVSARTLWYHDHAIGITAVNAYFGQAGFYILDDPNEDATLGLPQGQYDIPLMITSKQFLPGKSGQLLSPEEERVALYGDVITVNAQPWPFLAVEPRKYRFRLLDASISRTYKAYLVASGNPNVRIPFTVIGSDSGLVSTATSTTDIVLAIAERWDIVIDFAPFIGQNITMMNERDFQTNEDYFASDRIMQFRVGNTVTSTANNNLPTQLRTLDLPDPKVGIDHDFVFERKNGMWLINGVGFEDIENRILAKPERGATQQWILENKGGGWSHPIHVHLVDFQIVSRTGGRGAVEPYEKVALKDVVYLGENEKLQIIARYTPWDGVYMFHCHNLVHEDHDMMAAFNVTDLLTDFGYTDTMGLADPLDARFRSKPGVGPFDLNTVLTVDIPFLARLNAYANVPQVEAALVEYWQTHTATQI